MCACLTSLFHYSYSYFSAPFQNALFLIEESIKTRISINHIEGKARVKSLENHINIGIPIRPIVLSGEVSRYLEKSRKNKEQLYYVIGVSEHDTEGDKENEKLFKNLEYYPLAKQLLGL